jgi:hypothetical protein
MGVRLRDICVLLCCTALALLALQQEGDLDVQPVWFQPIEHITQTSGQARGSAVDSGMQLMTTYANGIAPLPNELVSVYRHAACIYSCMYM